MVSSPISPAEPDLRAVPDRGPDLGIVDQVLETGPALFIVGSGRSGTTLLRSLLSAHSRVTVTPETHYLKIAERRGFLEAGTDPAAFWQAYCRNVRFQDLGVDPRRCEALVEAQGGWSPRSLFLALLAAYGEDRGKALVGEKTPGHVAYMPLLKTWFPNARFLVCRRDPRAMIASYLKTIFAQQKLQAASLRQGLLTGTRMAEIDRLAREWRQIYGQDIARDPDDRRVRLVDYERLVDAPADEIAAICAFLDLPYEPEMLTDRAARVPAPQGRWADAETDRWSRDHHARSLGAITAASKDKWRRDLSDRDVARIEAICGPVMAQAGYALHTPKAVRPWARLRAVTIHRLADGEDRLRGAVPAVVRSGPVRRLKARLAPLGQAAVRAGVPARWTGYRWVREEGLAAHCARVRRKQPQVSCEPIHPPIQARADLPEGISDRADLPNERGWWGFSLRDVPTRRIAPTLLATLTDAVICWDTDPRWPGDLRPAILTQDGRALKMREVRFRPGHGAVLRNTGAVARRERAVFILERVFDNYSHWLTAHLPKLILLKERGLTQDLILPIDRPAFIDDSLKALDLKPDEIATFDPKRPLSVGRLTVMDTDRFRPELVRTVPRAFGITGQTPPTRRIFISRAEASRRRLLNEAAVWDRLQPHGFERLVMEALDFDDQVALMAQTAILCAPHGAGLTNMIFCPQGARVLELADPAYPNPNFYALAAALGHRYRRLPAPGQGVGHPLDRDLTADLDALDEALSTIDPEPFAA